MRKTKEVLRLRVERGLGQRQIARRWSGCGRDRLAVARGPERRLCLGPQLRKHFRVRSDRRGQESYRFGSGPKGLSRQPIGCDGSDGQVEAGGGVCPFQSGNSPNRRSRNLRAVSCRARLMARS
jgi:hypothetical protein